MSGTPNHYDPPREETKRPTEPAGLGVLLVGFLILQCIANLAGGAFFLFVPSIAHQKFPNDPTWSFPVRGALGFLIALTCILILRRRRIGLFAYFGLAGAAALFNIARDVSIGKAVVGSVVSAIVVALLIRRRLSLFS